MDIIRTKSQILRRKLREVGIVKPFRLKDGDPPEVILLSGYREREVGRLPLPVFQAAIEALEPGASLFDLADAIEFAESEYRRRYDGSESQSS